MVAERLRRPSVIPVGAGAAKTGDSLTGQNERLTDQVLRRPTEHQRDQAPETSVIAEAERRRARAAGKHIIEAV